MTMVKCKIATEQAKRAKRTARLADGYGLALLVVFAVVWKGL